MDLSRREVYNFPPFHFYPKSGELHGRGMVVRCPAQAAVVLDTLLSHAGQVVTREELRAALWPDGDSLAYDDAINKAISYLRQTLRDNSRSPNYIETLPKRGYRFVAAVDRQVEGEEARPASHEDQPALKPELPPESAETVETTAPAPEKAASHRPMRRALLFSVCAALVAGSVIGAWRYVAAHRAVVAVRERGTVLRVGIAPFEASGADSQALAESFRLDITDALAQAPQLRVSASHVTPSDAEGRHAMLLLHADVLIFGTFALDKKHVRLQLELAHGEDASHMATFRYDVAPKDLIGLREQVQNDLLLALKASRAREGAALGSTDNAEAYAVYQQARAHLQQWDSGRWFQAEKEFREAIARDPGFARAYSGLATTLIAEVEHGAIPQQGYEQARQSVAKALELDPQLAEGHAVLGNIAYRYDWNFALAEAEYRKAIALDPGHSHYHVWLAGLLCSLGRFRESIQEVNLAHELDPSWKSPYLAATAIFSSAGQDGRSLEVARQLVAMEPNSPIAHDQLGWSYWYSGSYAAAVAEWHAMALLNGDKDRQTLEEEGARILQRDGVKGYAELRLRAIESGKTWKTAALEFVPSEWFLYAGQPDNAIAALSSQIDRHEAAALQIGVDPAYAPLRQDPRYLMLLRRMHFTVPVLLKRDDWRSIWE